MAKADTRPKEYICGNLQKIERNDIPMFWQDCRAILKGVLGTPFSEERLIQGVNIAYSADKKTAVIPNLNTYNLSRNEASSFLQKITSTSKENGSNQIYVVGIPNQEDKAILEAQNFKKPKTIPSNAFTNYWKTLGLPLVKNQ